MDSSVVMHCQCRSAVKRASRLTEYMKDSADTTVLIEISDVLVSSLACTPHTMRRSDVFCRPITPCRSFTALLIQHPSLALVHQGGQCFLLHYLQHYSRQW